MTRDCLTIIALDGSVTVARLDPDVELWHRSGDLFSDARGSWCVDEVAHEDRCLVIVEVNTGPAFSLPELLAA